MNRLINLEEEFTQEYILLRKSVTCSICLEVYRDPVCLPCQHGFCESCISMALKVRDKCPICAAPAKKNKWKCIDHLDETLDLFRKLLGSIEQSLKVKKQSLLQQHKLSNVSTLQTSENSPLSVVAAEDETRFPRNEPLNLTQQSSDSESDLDIETNMIMKVDSFDSESILGLTPEKPDKIDERKANASSAVKPSRLFSPMKVKCPAKPRETIQKRSKKRTFEAEEPAMAVVQTPVTVNNGPINSNHEKESDMTTFLKLTIFEKGSFVMVLPRTWAGINKLGGVGRIESLRALNAQDETVDISSALEAQQQQCSEDRSEWLASLRVYYKVKYVLDGHVDDDVPSAFVEKFEELSRESRRTNISRQLVSPNGQTPSKTGSPAVTTLLPSASKLKQSPAISTLFGAKQSNLISSKVIVVAADKENETEATIPALIEGEEAIQSATTSNAVKKRRVLTLSKKLSNTANLVPAAAPARELIKESVGIADEAKVTGHKRKCSLVLLTTCIDEDESTIALVNRQLQQQSLLTHACSSFDEIFQCFLACYSSEISPSTHFSSSVTHVIVSVDKNSKVMKQRTMKYMQGLAHGVWIVSTQWLYESFLAGKLLDETPFEVKSNAKAIIPRAPMRARQAHLNKHIPGLFAGYVVVLFGLFPLPGPARSDLEDMVSVLGAQRIFTQMRHFWEYFCSLHRQSFKLTQDQEENITTYARPNLKKEDYPTIVIVRSKEVLANTRLDSEDVSEEERQWILDDFSTAGKTSDHYFGEERAFQDDGNSAESLQRLEQARLLQYFGTFPQVSALWVMDSVTNYEIQPFAQYIHPQSTSLMSLNRKASSNSSGALTNSSGKQKVKRSSAAMR